MKLQTMRALMGAGFLIGSCMSAAVAYAQPVPKRVVSINVCTDQLAMGLIGEGDTERAADRQLISVSRYARDPLMSAMVDEATQYPANYGQAEEVFLLKPEIVLASTFSSRATISMLRILGIQVEEFAPARSFTDIEVNIRRMGDLLGKQREAEAQIDFINAQLRSVKSAETSKTVALYYANNYTAGRGTLIDEVLQLAGLENLANKAGVKGASALPLEMLLLQKPEIVIKSSVETGPALAYQNFEHPALKTVENNAQVLSLPDNLTVCGGPFTVEAVTRLAEVARD